MDRNYTPIGQKIIRVGLFLLFIAMLSVLLSLAHWQWQRGVTKEMLLNRLKQTQTMAAVSLQEAKAVGWSDFQKIKVHGRFLPHRIILDNRMHDGVYGYHTLAIFVLDDGTHVVVDQGWLPMPSGGKGFEPPETDHRTLVGLVYRPDLYQVTDYPDYQPGNFWRLPGLNLEKIQQTIRPNASWLPFMVIQLLPESKLGRIPMLPVASSMPPERHYGYAVQWVLLAVAWCLLWGYAWRKSSKREPKCDD